MTVQQGRNPDNKLDLIFSQSSTLAQHQQLCTHITPAQRGGVMNVQPKLIKLMHVFVTVYQKVVFFSATAKGKEKVLTDQSFHFCG